MARYKYDEYKESKDVLQAQKDLQKHQKDQPEDYQSRWQEEMDKVLKELRDRKDFSYDPEDDALYRQYKDQYARQGKLAMMDTMGQASALTGGYDNSYAQTVGQQTYQGYLQQLGDKLPQLYSAALDHYDRQGEALFDQFAMLGDRESMDYGQYRDRVEDYQKELDRLQSLYDNARQEDYDRYADSRDFDYGAYRDRISDAKWQDEFDEAVRQWREEMRYQQYRDEKSDAQWEREFAEAMRQWQQEQEYEQSRDQVSDAQWQQRYGSTASTGSKSSNSKSSNSKSSNSGNDSAKNDSKKETTVQTEEEALADWIRQKAEEYDEKYPNVALDSRTLDYWLYENGFGGSSAAQFKESLRLIRAARALKG